MSTLAPTAPPASPRLARRTRIQNLVRRHEDLEALLEANRRHGRPISDLWLAMVTLEDRLRSESPRSYSHWIAIWLSRRPAGAHPRGGHSTDCILCQDPPRSGRVGDVR